jgi:aryl-alcohol dehydrogenase-like predicted oxidoreductase
METRRLGGTSIEVTPIGLGCMRFAGTGIVERVYPSLDEQTVRSVVQAALDGGVTWFDTAEMYGHGGSERAVTSALRALGVAPGGVRIATKWAPLFRRAASITKTIDARLAALQGYPVDLHQIHMPTGGFSSIRAQVEAMAGLCEAGKVNAVGVSNFSARQMELAHDVLSARGIELASNQVQVSLLHRNIERNGVLRAARRLGVTLIAFSPLRMGLLTGKFHADPARIRALPRVRRIMGAYRAAEMRRAEPVVRTLTAVAKTHGVTPAQVALSWLTTYYDDSVVAIPGASKPHQAAESAAAMSLKLTDRELNGLAEAAH